MSSLARLPSPPRLSSQPSLPIPLRALCLLLLVWEPLSLAVIASRVVDRVSVRGISLALLLALRIGAAGLGIAAGLAAWNRGPSALALMRGALVALAAVSVLTLTTPFFPNSRAPGTTGPLVAGTVIYYGGWLLYLARSARVKHTFG